MVTLCLAFPAGVLSDDPKKPDYYPLAKGNTWTYRISAPGATLTLKMTIEVTEIEVKGGKTIAKLESRNPDQPGKSQTAEIIADAKGVYRSSALDLKLDQPLTIIKYPIKAETWTETVTAAEKKLKATLTAKEAVEVTVPAGKFKAIPIKAVTELGGNQATLTTWYADGVGIVKQTADLGDIELVMELDKFTPGK
jgi:hypothetical protein